MLSLGTLSVVLVSRYHKIYIIFNVCIIFRIKSIKKMLSGRVLDSRPKGSGFEPHRRHCVVVLEQDTFILA